VGHEGNKISTYDLAGKGRFALLTGIGGEAWKEAAEEGSGRTGVQIACYVIGPGREVLDLYGDWARLSEVAESGCVLVRPDAHVAWRRHDVADDCTAELGQVMNRILGLEHPPSEEATRAKEATTKA
jgi:2,4-dichlorophenol 6-monooxygenase